MTTAIKKIPAWDIIMSTNNPILGRPRWFSIHTLATLMGRKNLKYLAKQMKDSGQVHIGYCPVVQSIIFFQAHRLGNNSMYWSQLDDFIINNPYPAIRGFRRSVDVWSGGSYGVGTLTRSPSGTNDPFVPEDYAYANIIIDRLRQAGYKPGIKKYKMT